MSFLPFQITGAPIANDSSPNSVAPSAGRTWAAPASPIGNVQGSSLVIDLKDGANAVVQVWYLADTSTWVAVGSNITVTPGVQGGPVAVPASASVFLQVVSTSGSPTTLYAGFSTQPAPTTGIDTLVARTPVIGPQAPASSLSGVAAQGTLMCWVISVTGTPARLIPAWVASTTYALGNMVTNDSGKVYRCITAGQAAGSGGPTGTGNNITDNVAHWAYMAASTAGLFKGSFIIRNLSTTGVSAFYCDANLGQSIGMELVTGQEAAIFEADPSTVFISCASTTTVYGAGYQ